jgi:hypothetical protein
MVKDLPIKLVFFISLIFFSTMSFSNTNEVIKLRLKEVNILYQPEKKSHGSNSKKTITFLNDFFIENGQSEKHYMNVILKRYNVKIIKEKNEDFFSLFKSEDRNFIHEVNLIIELREIEKNKLIETTTIDIQTSKKYDDAASLGTRRLVNNVIFKGVKKKLIKEFKRVFLLKFGDFVIPI